MCSIVNKNFRIHLIGQYDTFLQCTIIKQERKVVCNILPVISACLERRFLQLYSITRTKHVKK